MNLVIDIGNTSIKSALFQGKDLIKTYHQLSLQDMDSLISGIKPANILLGSVRGMEDEIRRMAGSSTKFIVLNHDLPLPIQNFYKSPGTLGVDRIAAAAGAALMFPDGAKLVIDAGTCITYEFINEKAYLGGSISPGIEMRFKALNSFTEKLPLIKRNDEAKLTGENTEESIQSGIINGIIAEVRGIMDSYKNSHPSLKVILCGGDYQFFESKIKESIFAVPDLVLIGLNSILLNNVKEN